MGYVSNQWLKGSPQRDRGHRPVKATFDLQVATDEWSNENGVLVTLFLTRQDGDFQMVSFDPEEIRQLSNFLIRDAATAVVVADALARLPDGVLLDTLKRVLDNRTAPTAE
jgi:hypothetical protein